MKKIFFKLVKDTIDKNLLKKRNVLEICREEEVETEEFQVFLISHSMIPLTAHSLIRNNKSKFIIKNS